MTLKIAGIQMAGSKDKVKNIDKAKELLRIAAEHGAKIICYPELFNTHWFPVEVNDVSFELAETEDGDTITQMREAAAAYKVTIIAPIFEKDGSGNHYNTAFIIGSDGSMLGKYQKVHLPQLPYWEEKNYFKGGRSGFPIFISEGIKFGILICWDNFFPEAVRILALKGADIIFSPTAAAFASHNKWETAIRANSIVNGVYSFRVNRVGRENNILNFYGKSFCSGPDGNLTDEPAGSQEGVVIVDINTSEIKKTRSTWSFFKERKKELYTEMLKIDTETESHHHKKDM